MKRSCTRGAITVIMALAASCLTAPAALSQAAPSVTLSPNSGFAALTVSGTGFPGSTGVIILWDSAQVPTVPATVVASQTGAFTAIIAVPNQAPAGDHAVLARSLATAPQVQAGANFRVIDMTGPVGPVGLTGPAGAAGAAGSSTSGTVGPQGEKGDLGPAGPQGPRGEQGPKGDAGPPGPAGAASKSSVAALALAVIAVLVVVLGRVFKWIAG